MLAVRNLTNLVKEVYTDKSAIHRQKLFQLYNRIQEVGNLEMSITGHYPRNKTFWSKPGIEKNYFSYTWEIGNSYS